MSKGKGESGTNNLLDLQILANLQRLLLWHSGDEDGLQSQRFGVQIQLSAKKKKWGTRSRDRGSVGLGIGIGSGGVNRVRNWYTVRACGEHVTLFEKHPSPPKKKRKSEKII